MPHKSGNLKQRNKPFKGASKHKAEVKNFGLVPSSKKISKAEKPLTKDARLNKLKQWKENKAKTSNKDFEITNDSMLKDAFQSLKSKMPGAPRVVLIAGFNDAATPEIIKANIGQILANQNQDLPISAKSATIEGNFAHDFDYVRIATSNKISPELKNENYIFLTCPRNPETFLDYCKVADIVCVALSCKNVDQSTLLLNPFENAKAFDEIGYMMLTCLRAQGFPRVIGVLQDLETINTNKQAQVKQIFNRFFESELGAEEKCVSLNNNDEKTYMNFMRVLQEVSLNKIEWREMRSYILAEKIQVSPQSQILEIEGFLKGNSFSPNQLIHVTGYGDYPVLQVDILHNPFMPNYKKQKLIEEMTVYGFTPDENALATFLTDEQKMDDYSMFPNEATEGLKRIKEKEKEKNDNPFDLEEFKSSDIKDSLIVEETKDIVDNREDKMLMENEGDVEFPDQASDVSFDENQSGNFVNSAIQEEKKQLRQLAKRNDEDKEFEDEADYGTDIKASERFSKYKALKNFRTTEWNPYKDLPLEYGKIFLFDDFQKSKKNAIDKAQKEAIAYNGFYVKIYIAGFPVDSLVNHNNETPLVVSSLFAHERKISVLNLKVQRYNESSDPVKSKENTEIHLGFRKFNSQPIFSKLFSSTAKSKYEKKVSKNQIYMASFYGEVTYTPANAIIFGFNENGVKELIASGELMKPDPLRIILKRALLTGYPLKIHKRIAIIKMMFFNPEDVNYFKNVELSTKNGLRGFIKESLGTHGYMKCVFNSPIKHNDTVCLSLYKRVFPKWLFDPVQPSFSQSAGIFSLE